MANWVTNESFWTMITLFFFFIEISSWWTVHTIFSIPKRFIWGAYTLICTSIVSHNSTIYNFTFTLIVHWIYSSWSITFEVFASCCSIAILEVLWTWFTSWVNCIKDIRSFASYTIVEYFIKSLRATWFNLEFTPTWVWIRECSWCCWCCWCSRGCSSSTKLLRKYAE